MTLLIQVKEKFDFPVAVPHTGTIDFDGPADDALNTLSNLLGSSNVHMRVIWTVNKEDKKCVTERH